MQLPGACVEDLHAPANRPCGGYVGNGVSLCIDDRAVAESLDAIRAQILIGELLDRLELPTCERARPTRVRRSGSLQEMFPLGLRRSRVAKYPRRGTRAAAITV